MGTSKACYKTDFPNHVGRSVPARPPNILLRPAQVAARCGFLRAGVPMVPTEYFKRIGRE
jgi:hypothetical protein